MLPVRRPSLSNGQGRHSQSGDQPSMARVHSIRHSRSLEVLSSCRSIPLTTLRRQGTESKLQTVEEASTILNARFKQQSTTVDHANAATVLLNDVLRSNSKQGSVRRKSKKRYSLPLSRSTPLSLDLLARDWTISDGSQADDEVLQVGTMSEFLTRTSTPSLASASSPSEIESEDPQIVQGLLEGWTGRVIPTVKDATSAKPDNRTPSLGKEVTQLSKLIFASPNVSPDISPNLDTKSCLLGKFASVPADLSKISDAAPFLAIDCLDFGLPTS